MKSGRRLFGRELSDDEALAGLIRNLIDKFFPAAEDPHRKEDSAQKDGSSAKVPPWGGGKRKGKSRP
jgi:hypothetical protein